MKKKMIDFNLGVDASILYVDLLYVLQIHVELTVNNYSLH